MKNHFNLGFVEWFLIKSMFHSIEDKYSTTLNHPL